MDLRCPRCGRRNVTPVRRRGVLDRVAALSFYRPFVCDGCHRRVRIYVTPLEAAVLPARKEG